MADIINDFVKWKCSLAKRQSPGGDTGLYDVTQLVQIGQPISLTPREAHINNYGVLNTAGNIVAELIFHDDEVFLLTGQDAIFPSS